MHAAFLWLWYVLGGFGSMWKRANLSVASAHTPWESIKEYLVPHGPEMFVNFILSTALFWSWWHDPTLVNKAMDTIGLSTDKSIPLNPFTATMFGVFSDQIMDFVVAKIKSKFGKQQP